MLGFGWKKKAEILRVTIISAGHRIAKPLSPKFERILDLFGQAAKTGFVDDLAAELASEQDKVTDLDRPLWEPAEIYGWKFQATLYRKDEKLWWLVHASRQSPEPPSDKHIAFLNKVLEHLGAQPERHAIITPSHPPPGQDRLPFGWWTWQNHHDLMDIQVNKAKRGKDMLRFVPAGSRGSDGYETVDTSKRADLGELDKEPDAGA